MSTARARDHRGVLRAVGVVLTGFGAMMATCAAVGALVDALHSTTLPAPSGLRGMVVSTVLTVGVGILLTRQGRGRKVGVVSRREATLAVAAIWLSTSAFGALPFVLGAGMSPAASFFETASALTTTGATALADIEGTLSRPLLLWRAGMQWIGGMGIVVLFVAVFPSVGAGGKHMFQGEVPGTTADALTPRIAETSFALWKIYASLTVVLLVFLVLLGMDPFEAVCHAFTTLSTGGFSTRDASIAAFQSPAIEVVIAVFMYLASLNFALFFVALRTRSLRGLLRNTELRVFVAVAVVSVLAVTLGTLHLYDGQLLPALRYAFFAVGTFMSSTGFTTSDHALYPPPVLGLVLVLMFMGGCSGSTAGGMKVERLVLIAKQAVSQVKRSFRPNVIDVVRLGRQAVAADVLVDVSAFFAIFFGTVVASVLLLTLTDGLPLSAALGATLTSVSNMGPAPFYVGQDNFASYSAAGKVVCALVMLLGRLEFFTLLALCVPAFWRR